MTMQTLNAPSGPRAGRNGESRLSHRGGIQKRGQQKQRLDKDGDMEMDLASKFKGRGRGTNNRRDSIRATSHGVTTHSNPTPTKPRSTKVDLATVQKSVLRGMGEKELLPKGPKALSRLTRHAGKDAKEGGAAGVLDLINIYGLKDSKAASNPGGGVKELLDFLERKATAPNTISKDTVRIRKSRQEGDAVIISVRPEDTPKITRLNNFTFAGATLRIELHQQTTPQTSTTTTSEAADVKELLRSVLARRYNQESKELDLSRLGNDPELINSGIFGSDSTTSKLFPALMSVCDNVFATEQQKTEAVHSVSLANNELANVEAVKTLARTFPHITTLDLSNNHFKSIWNMDPWRTKFRKLGLIKVGGNPLTDGDPSFMAKLMEWYPTLRTIDTFRVKEESTPPKNDKLPIWTGPAYFRDDNDIAKNFLTRFFPAYDQNRSSLVKDYYDKQTYYSMSANTKSPRDQRTTKGSISWDRYIHSSRNLKLINTMPKKKGRLHTGAMYIEEEWKHLPKTRHPDLMTEGDKWLIECHPISGVPDLKRTKGGVEGFLIVVHGEFTELDQKTGKDTSIKRSFDRLFVLGPGEGVGGIRVVNDMLHVRAYGGFEAFKPDDEMQAFMAVIPRTSLPNNPLLQKLGVPDDFGSPVAGKLEELIAKERMALELTNRSGMTIQYSGMCLEGSQWDLEKAYMDFERVKGTLPIEAFVQL